MLLQFKGFTSATLTVDENFNHYTKLLGLVPEKEIILDSPFDSIPVIALYSCYLPNAQYNRVDSLVDIAIKIIDASRGGCFLFFTSHAMIPGQKF